MPRFAIVTAGDDKYLSILQGLVLSIRDKPEGAAVPIVVLDVGLGPEAKAWLTRHGAVTFVPGWDFPFEKPMPVYLKAMVSRPRLPRYIQGAECLIWLDADTWVQRWSAIELLLEGAAEAGFAIVPELDRSYSPIYDGAPMANQLYQWYSQCFDVETARSLSFHPLLNCGVFAARADAPHWEVWATLLDESLRRAVLFVSEQTALNVALRTRGLAMSQLPASCNWIAYRAPPLCTPDGRILLDPQLPHEPLGIVHLAGYHYEQKEKPQPLAVLGGGTVTRPLSYVRN
jgi:hypothetical protein